jgi:acyl-coenzyme A thioesterase PaaI-like protein
MIQNLKKQNEVVDIMTRMVEHSKAIIRGTAPPPPVAKLIGFDVVSVESGEAVVEFQATEVHRNPMGTLHGGILCDIADAAMGIAYDQSR